MGLWDMIIIVTLAGVISGIIFERMKSKERLEMARLDKGTDSDKYTLLEDRVRVLERIVTDKKARLSDEIDAL